MNTGTYIVQVRTKDKDGNLFITERTLDIILENSSNVDIKVWYAADTIKIFGETANIEWARIKIYNIAGERVREFNPQDSVLMNFEWDKKTSSGTGLAAGIYVLVVEYKDKHTGRINRKIEKLAIK